MPPLCANKEEKQIYGAVSILALCAYTAFISYQIGEKKINQWIDGPPKIGFGTIDLDPAKTEVAGRKIIYYDKLARCVTQETSIGWSADRYFDTDHNGSLDTRISYALVKGLGAVPTKRTTIAEHPEYFTDVNLKYQQMIQQERKKQMQEKKK